MLTITNNEGNTNQNSDITSHLSEWLLSKRNSKSWQAYREKGIVIHCSWECKLVQPTRKRVWGFFRQLKTKLPYDSAILFPGFYL